MRARWIIVAVAVAVMLYLYFEYESATGSFDSWFAGALSQLPGGQ